MAIRAQVLLVGNCCHDRLIHSEGVTETLGGSAAFASAVFAAAGISFEAVSFVGEDFRFAGSLSFSPTVIPGSSTARFVSDLRENPRQLRLEARCVPIRASNLPSSARFRIGMACGVAMELLPETLEAMRELCDIVVADAQSLIRESRTDGTIFHVELARTGFAPLASSIDFLKASREEAGFLELERLRESTHVLITEGARGSRILYGSLDHHAPAFPAREVDPTGAGDCFLAGFVAALLHGRDLRDALLAANRLGAMAVEEAGVPRFDPHRLQEALETR